MVELLAEIGLQRISHVERRIRREYEEALAIRRSESGSCFQGLLVGNSLLADGVDLSLLQAGLGLQIEIRRLEIDQTQFFDWYFGLRNLLKNGARPNRVYVLLAPRHFVSSGWRGDYSAHRLLSGTDSLEASRTLGLSPTAASSLLFANWSWFYGLRAEIRGWLFAELVPGFGHLRHYIVPKVKPRPSNEVIYAVGLDRLKQLREVAETHGSSFAVILPPTPAVDDGSEALKKAGSAANVQVHIPIPPGQMGPNMFSDNFHLNEQGAREFTRVLIQEFRSDALSRLSTQSADRGRPVPSR